MGNKDAEKLRDLIPIPVPDQAKGNDVQSIAKLDLIKGKRDDLT